MIRHKQGRILKSMKFFKCLKISFNTTFIAIRFLNFSLKSTVCLTEQSLLGSFFCKISFWVVRANLVWVWGAQLHITITPLMYDYTVTRTSASTLTKSHPFFGANQCFCTGRHSNATVLSAQRYLKQLDSLIIGVRPLSSAMSTSHSNEYPCHSDRRLGQNIAGQAAKQGSRRLLLL